MFSEFFLDCKRELPIARLKLLPTQTIQTPPRFKTDSNKPNLSQTLNTLEAIDRVDKTTVYRRRPASRTKTPVISHSNAGEITSVVLQRQVIASHQQQQQSSPRRDDSLIAGV